MNLTIKATYNRATGAFCVNKATIYISEQRAQRWIENEIEAGKRIIFAVLN